MRHSVRMRLIGLAGIAAIMVAGCAHYVAPSLAEGEAARLTCESSTLNIEKIDGKRPGWTHFVKKTTLAPGPHEIRLAYYEIDSEFFAQSSSYAGDDLVLPAEAGQDYVAKCAMVGFGVCFWIEDARTNQVVAGSKPQSPAADGITNPDEAILNQH